MTATAARLRRGRLPGRTKEATGLRTEFALAGLFLRRAEDGELFQARSADALA